LTRVGSIALEFEATIEASLLELKSRFKVRKVLFDPYQMHASAQRLAKAGLKMEEFPQSVPNLTEASTHLYELIKGCSLVVYPNAALRLAVSRAVAVEGSRGWKISKDKQAHKIDVVIALGMAALAAVRGQSESTYDSTYSWVGDDTDQEASWRAARLQQHILLYGGYYR
jgi:phage terminase large subunit-like protein